MRISRIKLTNWRNFLDVDVNLGSRVFVVGANASGKSNFLDVFRFLRDLVKPGGGLQQAIMDRGGFSKVRCLNARSPSHVGIEISLTDGDPEKSVFVYGLEISQETRGRREPIVRKEYVIYKGREVFSRPESEDEDDPQRLTQTYLEQISKNKDFRGVADYLKNVVYLHLVPQLLKYADTLYAVAPNADDPFGRTFLERISKTSEKTRINRLKKIGQAIRYAVPQFKELELVTDKGTGAPHLQARYEHWRPQGAYQREDQFSDGTLRLMGLFWSILDGDALLLLEEPELSLHAAVVKHLPGVLSRLGRKRQVVISTHSADMLTDQGIGGEEVLVLIPDKHGTKVKTVDDIKGVRKMLQSGFTVGEVVMPFTNPADAAKLSQFSFSF